MKSIQNTREQDLERAEMLLEQAKPNVELEIFDEPTVVALEEAMQLFEKWEVKEKMAEVYEYLGDYYKSNRSKYREARYFFDKSLELHISIHGTLHESTAKIHCKLAMVLVHISIDEAKPYFHKALNIYTDLFGEQCMGVVQCYHQIAAMYFSHQKYHEAIPYFLSAINIAEKLVPTPYAKLGSIYADLGSSYGAIKNFVAFKHTLDKCKQYYELSPIITPEKNAQLYFQIGSFYKKIYDFKSAALYLEKSAKISHSIKSIYTVFPYHALFDIFSIQEEYDKAFNYAQKCLELIDKYNITIANIDISVYSNFVFYYIKQGEMSKAWEYILKIMNRFENLDSDNYMLEGGIYVILGRYHSYNNSFNEAMGYFEKSLKICEQNADASANYLHSLMTRIGEMFIRKQDYKKALTYHHKALMAMIGIQSIDIYDSSVLDKFDKSINYPLFIDLVLDKAKAFLLCYIHENKTLKDLKAALANYQIVFDFTDSIRKSFYPEDSKLRIMKKLQEGFANTIYLIYDLFKITGDETHLNHAFNLAERNKAFLLLQNNQENITKQKIKLPPHLNQLENELKTRLILLQKSIQSQKQKEENADQKLLQEWQADYFNTYTRFETLKKQFETDYPDYYRQKYSTETVSISSLQSSLQSHQTVLSYFIGEEKIYLFAITTDEYEVFAMEKPENFTEFIQSYLQSIKFHQKQTFQQLSFELYQTLIQEAIDYLIDPFEEEARQVFIIPHAELHYLPFETLIIQEAKESDTYKDLDYLLQHCQISYHYSATLLYLDLQKQKIEAERAPTDIAFTGFAPVYEVSSNEQKQALEVMQQEYATAVNRSEAVRGDGTWMPLPYSKLEVENIVQLFKQKGLESQAFLHESATKRTLEEQIGKSRFVLIAAHGIVNDEFPELSGLVLAGGGGRQTENGERNTVENSPSFEFPLRRGQGEVTGDIWNEQRSLIQKTTDDCILNMKEVAMIPMNAELVVLSSCESGIGELHKGEGMMAVNRGFLASGAKNVVSTLFKVNDKASSELTTLMFGYILEGDAYTVALQKAKLELLEKGVDISPKMWSGFVLFGVGE